MSDTKEKTTVRHISPTELGTDELKKQIEILKTQLDDIKTHLVGEKAQLVERTAELRALKARKLDAQILAKIVGWLCGIIGLGFIALSFYILNHDLSWMQICSVLGLCLLWTSFTAVNIRILSDRSK